MSLCDDGRQGLEDATWSARRQAEDEERSRWLEERLGLVPHYDRLSFILCQFCPSRIGITNKSGVCSVCRNLNRRRKIADTRLALAKKAKLGSE